jgi:uncharacterized Zn-binding protein involved in type VI secretion
MFPITTNGGGQAALTGPLDVCKTPSPGGPVPIPYPNFAMMNQIDGSTASSKVKTVNMKTAYKGTKTTMTTGDEGGTAGGGVKSNKIKGPCEIKQGSSKVKIEGKPAATVTKMTGHNDSPNNNMPAGTIVAPSQTKVQAAS